VGGREDRFSRRTTTWREFFKESWDHTSGNLRLEKSINETTDKLAPQYRVRTERGGEKKISVWVGIPNIDSGLRRTL